jgi:hypothetical protein
VERVRRKCLLCGNLRAMLNKRTRAMSAPLLAGKRPIDRFRQSHSHFSLLGYFQGVIHFDTEVADCAFQLRMT